MKRLLLLLIVLSQISFKACTNKRPELTALNIQFVKETEIDFTGSDREVFVYQPSFYDVDTKGNIYIVDRSDLTINVLNPTGEYITSFGGMGQGPEEYIRINYMQIIPEDRLLIQDNRNKRTTICSITGEYFKSFTWKFYTPGTVYFASDTSFWVKYMNRDRNYDIREFNFSGELVNTFCELYPVQGGKEVTVGTFRATHYLRYGPRSIITADRRKHLIYHCYNAQYSIDVYNSRGEIIRRINQCYAPLPVTEADKSYERKQYIAAWRNDKAPAEKIAAEIEFAEHKPAMKNMLVDGDSNVWVETYEEKEEGSTTLTAYEIFNSEGEYVGKTWVRIKPGVFIDNKMYRMESDEETDLRKLVRYAVNWN